MFRSIRQSSAKYNNSGSSSNSDNKLNGEKQKQKKRLSFKDPEVEKPPEPPRNVYNASSSQDKDFYSTAAAIHDFEDFHTEDKSRHSERQVENPCRDRSRSPDPRRISDKSKLTKDQDREQIDRETFVESPPVFSNRQNTKLVLHSTEENKDYLEVLSPPKPEAAAMKCPVIEFIGEDEEEEDRKSQSVKNLGVVDVEPLPTSARHQIQLLNYQLEQQRQQTQTAMYQIQLLKDQLEAESAARYKAQIHNHQLMLKNKELLDHIQKLFHQVQDLEKKIEKLESDSVSHGSKQVYSEGPCKNPIAYRRNSGSTQSLWSSSSFLSPAYATSRRGSATSLIQHTVATENSSEQTENFKKPGKVEVSTKFSSLSPDTDWKGKRRGSSGNYNTLDFSRIRSNTDVGGDRYSGLKNQIPSFSSTVESIQESAYGQRRSESVSGLDRANRKTITIDDSLMIGEITRNDYGASTAGARGPSLEPIGARGPSLEPIGARGSSSMDKSSERIELSGRKPDAPDRAPKEGKSIFSTKKSPGSLNLKDSHSKLAQSLETLRLFNS